MIHTSRTVTVGKMESIINEPIVLYRGDREVEVEFLIVGSKFMFTNGGNVIKSTNATHGQLVVNTPTGENMFSEVTECHEGRVVFVITKEMIDELVEVGFYSFQIRLFDDTQVSRVTIPPVHQGIDIRNPIAAEDETDLVDIGLVDYSVVRKNDFENVATFLPNGDYNKTNWESNDVISVDRLNKVDDALYEINREMKNTDKALLNDFDNLTLNVSRQMKDFTKEMEDEVEQIERDLNKKFGELKVDAGADMKERMNAVEGELDAVEGELSLKSDKKEVMIHFIQLNSFGEAILIQTPNSNIMIDFAQKADTSVILDYLKRYNVTSLDYIIISHYHSDHVGAMENVLNALNVSDCVAYLPVEPDFNRFNLNGNQFRTATNKVYDILRNKSINFIFPEENQVVDIDNISIRFNNCNLDIFERYYNTTHEYATNEGETDYNNFSLVATLIHENVKVLFTGDINTTAQQAILSYLDRCDALKAEHHSVNSLVYEPYLKKVDPKIVVSCNVNQSSIHKSMTTRAFDGKEYYITYYSGDVILSSNGEKINTVTNNKRFSTVESSAPRIFNQFSDILPSYDENTTTLSEIVDAMPSLSMTTQNVIHGKPSCPEFISSYNGVIEIFKSSANKATLKAKDTNPNIFGVYEGVWRKDTNTITWYEVKNKNEHEATIYKTFAAFGMENTTDALTVIKNMPPNTTYDGFVAQAFAPNLLSSYNGIATIQKISANAARIILSDCNPNLGAMWLGVYHSSQNVIKWFKLNATVI